MIHWKSPYVLNHLSISPWKYTTFCFIIMLHYWAYTNLEFLYFPELFLLSLWSKPLSLIILSASIFNNTKITYTNIAAFLPLSIYLIYLFLCIKYLWRISCKQYITGFVLKRHTDNRWLLPRSLDHYHLLWLSMHLDLFLLYYFVLIILFSIYSFSTFYYYSNQNFIIHFPYSSTCLEVTVSL